MENQKIRLKNFINSIESLIAIQPELSSTNPNSLTPNKKPLNSNITTTSSNSTKSQQSIVSQLRIAIREIIHVW